MNGADGLVFKPFRKVNTFAGLQLKNWGKVAVIVAIGAMVAVLLRGITMPVEVGRTASEIQSETSAFLEAQRVEKTMESKVNSLLINIDNPTAQQKKEATAKAKESLSSSQQESLELAEKYKITTDMDQETLKSLVTTTKTENQPVIPDMARVVIFVIVPMVIAIVWWMDLKGWSYSTEVKRFLQFRKRKAMLVSKKQHYLTV